MVRWSVLAAALLVAVAPAQAAFLPVTYYLKDADLGPLAPGRLDTIAPPMLYLPPTDPVNYTGGPLQYVQDVGENMTNQGAQTRLILTAQDTVLPVQFVTEANPAGGPGRILGPVLVFLVVPKTPLVQHANLSMELIMIQNATAPLYQGGDVSVLASAEIPVDGNDTPLPDPASFIPPNSTDPQAAAAYVAGQLLLYGITTVVEGFKYAYLDDAVKDYVVDANVPDGAMLALRLKLVANDGSPLPLPIPDGLAQPMLYNTTLTPALVYLQFYEPDPPKPVPSTTPPHPTSSTSKPPSSSSPATESGGGSKGIPGPVVVPLALAFVGAALWSRRRKA